LKKTKNKPVVASTSKSSKTKKSYLESSPEAESEAESSEAEAEISRKKHSDYLYGFTTDDDDSSDDDGAAMDSGPDESKLGVWPIIAKDDASVRRKLEIAKRQPTEDRGVLYLGRLPHGFYEDQLRGYFSQFGSITRLRLSRNKKTGRSKHYAFLEFDSSSVAKIVSETMDDYLLMGHLLRCEVIPKDKVHPELWVGANKKWKKIPMDRIERLKHDKPRTAEEMEKAENRLIKRQNEKKRKLEEAGIKYKFDAVAYKKSQILR